MSDASILRTFWVAAVIQFIAFLFAVYFAKVYGSKSKSTDFADYTDKI